MSKEKQKNNFKFNSNIRKKHNVSEHVVKSAVEVHSNSHNTTAKLELDSIWFPGDIYDLIGEPAVYDNESAGN